CTRRDGLPRVLGQPRQTDTRFRRELVLRRPWPTPVLPHRRSAAGNQPDQDDHRRRAGSDHACGSERHAGRNAYTIREALQRIPRTTRASGAYRPRPNPWCPGTDRRNGGTVIKPRAALWRFLIASALATVVFILIINVLRQPVASETHSYTAEF